VWGPPTTKRKGDTGDINPIGCQVALRFPRLGEQPPSSPLCREDLALRGDLRVPTRGAVAKQQDAVNAGARVPIPRPNGENQKTSSVKLVGYETASGSRMNFLLLLNYGTNYGTRKTTLLVSVPPGVIT
jgi:hypothetical protein